LLRAEKSSCELKRYAAGRETLMRTQKTCCGPRNFDANSKNLLRAEKLGRELKRLAADRETSMRTQKTCCGPKNFNANPKDLLRAEKLFSKRFFYAYDSISKMSINRQYAILCINIKKYLLIPKLKLMSSTDPCAYWIASKRQIQRFAGT